jgi:hypothetical protein
VPQVRFSTWVLGLRTGRPSRPGDWLGCSVLIALRTDDIEVFILRWAAWASHKLTHIGPPWVRKSTDDAPRTETFLAGNSPRGRIYRERTREGRSGEFFCQVLFRYFSSSDLVFERSAVQRFHGSRETPRVPQVRFSTWVLGLRLRSAEAPINNPGFEVCFWLDSKLTTKLYYNLGKMRRLGIDAPSPPRSCFSLSRPRVTSFRINTYNLLENPPLESTLTKKRA